MGQNAGSRLVRRPEERRATPVFGCPGDGVDETVAEPGRAERGPRLVRSRHEETPAPRSGGAGWGR